MAVTLTDIWAVYGPADTYYFRVDASGNLYGSGQDFGSTSAEGGSIYLGDAKTLGFGADQDFTMAHSGTAMAITNATGNVTFDNTAATGKWYYDLGTDTNATGFYVRNNSGATLFSVTGDGALSLAGPWVVGDDVQWRFGASTDATIEYVGATNDWLFNNNTATASFLMKLGTDTNATDFQIVNNSGTAEFVVMGDGTTHIGYNAADTGAITIGNVAAAKAISIGHASSASLTMEAGVGAWSLTGDTTGALVSGTTMDLQSGTALTIDSSGGAIKIGGDANAQNIEIGNSAAARAIIIGNAASASLKLEAGVGGLDVDADTTIALDAGGAVTIESSAGAISVGAGAVAQPVNIATGAAARVISIGNAASASLALESGVGAWSVTGDTTGGLTVGTTLTATAPTSIVVASPVLSLATQGVSETIKDNEASALDINEGGNSYLKFTTTNNGEVVTFGKPVLRETAAIDVSIRRHVHVEDDFCYQTLLETSTPWILNTGGAAPAADPAIIAAREEGAIVLTTGNTNGALGDSSQIVCSVPMQADGGGLYGECRLHINTAVSAVRVVVGFTDSTANEEPASITAGAYTTTASDLVAFVYDTNATTDEWHAVAVDSDTDDAACGTVGVAPVADTYQTLRIEVDSTGATCKFFVNGTLVKTLSADAGVSPDVNLYFTVYANCDAATHAARTVDVDYIVADAIRV